MDLTAATAEVESVFWRNIFSGPLNAKQKTIQKMFPDTLKLAQESEFLFYFGSDIPSTIYIILKGFEIVSDKNIEFIRDVVEGNVSKVKRFLRINRSKKVDTTLRIAVNLSCSFNQAGVLDLLIKNLKRDFLAKFEHIFLPLAYLRPAGNKDMSSILVDTGFRDVFKVVLKWSEFPKKMIDLNNPSDCSFKTYFFFYSKVEAIESLLKTEVIKMNPGEWVEQFNIFALASARMGRMEEDIFKVFPPHDYFLEKMKSEIDDCTRRKFYDDASDIKVKYDGIKMGTKVEDDTNPVPEIKDVITIDHVVAEKNDDEDANGTFPTSVDNSDLEKVPEPKTLHEKYNIRNDISEEDLVEILELFDQVISAAIREKLMNVVIEKLM